MKAIEQIQFSLPEIGKCSPIVIIGAGGIVEAAHLPAYQLAGIPVAGIFDLDLSKSEKLAKTFGITNVYNSLDDTVHANGTNCIYDVAVPGSKVSEVITKIPDNSFVLIQKPMGEHLQQAEEILQLCRQKKLVAGVNFQLRYAPYIQMAKQMIAAGLLGKVCDVEVYINVYTPWHLWDFLKNADRVEILYHSIHYIDLVRNMLGEPVDIYAKTTRHPRMDHLQAVRSNIIMDYGAFTRVNIATNHAHDFGCKHQDAFIKIEGTLGAIKIKLGVLMNYPLGNEDVFEYILLDDESPEWKSLPIQGSWFPHGFIGSMYELIKTQQGITKLPDNSVEDCFHTMKWVEIAYQKSEGLL